MASGPSITFGVGNFLSADEAGSAAALPPDQITSPDQFARQQLAGWRSMILDAINELRAEQGVLPVKTLDALNMLAQQDADYQVNPEKVEAPHPQEDFARLAPPGWLGGSRNVAFGCPPQDLVDKMRDTPESMQNMVDPRATHVGIGVTRGANQTFYFAQYFAGYPQGLPGNNDSRQTANTQAPNVRAARTYGLEPAIVGTQSSVAPTTGLPAVEREPAYSSHPASPSVDQVLTERKQSITRSGTTGKGSVRSEPLQEQAHQWHARHFAPEPEVRLGERPVTNVPAVASTAGKHAPSASSSATLGEAATTSTTNSDANSTASVASSSTDTVEMVEGAAQVIKERATREREAHERAARERATAERVIRERVIRERDKSAPKPVPSRLQGLNPAIVAPEVALAEVAAEQAKVSKIVRPVDLEPARITGEQAQTEDSASSSVPARPSRARRFATSPEELDKAYMPERPVGPAPARRLAGTPKTAVASEPHTVAEPQAPVRPAPRRLAPIRQDKPAQQTEPLLNAPEEPVLEGLEPMSTQSRKESLSSPLSDAAISEASQTAARAEEAMRRMSSRLWATRDEVGPPPPSTSRRLTLRPESAAGATNTSAYAQAQSSERPRGRRFAQQQESLPEQPVPLPPARATHLAGQEKPRIPGRRWAEPRFDTFE